MLDRPDVRDDQLLKGGADYDDRARALGYFRETFGPDGLISYIRRAGRTHPTQSSRRSAH